MGNFDVECYGVLVELLRIAACRFRPDQGRFFVGGIFGGGEDTDLFSECAQDVHCSLLSLVAVI